MKAMLRISAVAIVTAVSAVAVSGQAEARNSRMVHIDENTGHGYWDGRNDGIVCTYGWRWKYIPYLGRHVQYRGRTCGRYW